MNAVAVIPARFASRRFPGKPLAPILGRPMIAWVIAAAKLAKRIERVIVATDDERIADAARAEGVEARMTRADHATGTDRVAEAVEGLDAEVILNLQGDEPALSPRAVDGLVDAFADPAVRMATLAVRGVSAAERDDPMIVKIVVDRNGDALYFSRGPIPYPGPGREKSPDVETLGFRHVGTYGFRSEALAAFVAEPRGGLEAAEDLEQLRALDLGWRIRVVEVDDAPVCVDVPDDIPAVEAILRAREEGVIR